MGRLETKVVGFRSWRVAAVAAVLGWLLMIVLLVVGARPLGWIGLGAAVVTVAASTLYRGRAGFGRRRWQRSRSRA